MRALIALALLMVSACSTPYNRDVGFTGGTEVVQYNERMFHIKSRGNGYTSADRVQEYAMLRAAELGREMGFTRFVIVDDNSSTSSQLIANAGSPGTTNTSCYDYGYGVNCNSNTVGAVAPSVTNIKRARTGLTVYYLTENDPNIATALNVDVVYRQLAAKYLEN